MTDGHTARLRIEPLGLEHADGLFAALDDERVGTYIGGPDVTTLAALRDRIARLAAGPQPGRDERWLNWAVLAGEVVVGRIEATLHDGVAEVAYVFGPAWWGRGYASEAVAWMVGELQAGWNAAACWATVAPGNDASVRLLTRLGFQPAVPDLPLYSYDDGDLCFTRVATDLWAAPVADAATTHSQMPD